MISALFVRKDSIYKKLGIDSYDIERNALTWPPGSSVIITHPPCTLWSRLAALSKAPIEEKQLAIWTLWQIRQSPKGGILEHPAGSKIWTELKLPKPGSFDEYKGWTLNIDQFWFGHKAKKNTTLYIKGCNPNHIPDIPYRLDAITHTIGGAKPGLKQMGKKENEETPIQFAKWLIQIANIIDLNTQ